MATSINQDDFQKTALRLPKELHAQLHAAAQESGRSYNAEIIARLQSSFDDQAGNSVARINELELELSKQRLITFAEQHKVTEYSFALMELAERLPAGIFADNPRIETFLKDARDNRDAKMIEAIDNMLKNANTLMSDLQENVKTGRIKVVSEQKKAEFLQSKQIEVVVRGKKQVIQINPENPEVKPKGNTILTGNLGNDPGINYLPDHAVLQIRAEPKPINKGPIKRVRNKPPQ